MCDLLIPEYPRPLIPPPFLPSVPPRKHDLSQYQSGFRSFHSTVTALLEASDNWAFNIDRGYINTVVFLDLKRVSDTVNHPILLSKLYSYGIKGNTYELLSSYLGNRTQKCAVNGVLSKSCTLTCGIP